MLFRFKARYQRHLKSPADENKAIIAIGGASKHYKFDQEIFIKQLEYILSVHPKHEFKIFNSRRTPEALNLKLKDGCINMPNAKFIDLNSPESDAFQGSLNESALKFVTPDSSNLVFEALSTKGQTYLIQIENPKYRRIFGAKKIRESMNELVNSKRVGVVSILNKKGGIDISKIESPFTTF
jgi:mitochondrial fission protein ELM1